VSDQTPSVALNQNQRRHFEVLFARLEDSVSKIERLLFHPDQAARLSLIEDDVSPAFRTLAASELPRIRAEIERLIATLSLKPRAVSLRRTIGATLTTEAVRLEDSFSSHLRGYGSVDETVAHALDPALDALAGSLRTLSASLTR
jgi:hypothetical protein